ncbi:MAG: transposase, partial [Myxococcales bacterium]|nr:transposase [Myxococcales bacterium]
GAGRKPKGVRPQVSHHARPYFDKPAAVHVTLRVDHHVWNLRSQRCFRVLKQALRDALGRFGLRVIHFSVQGNHLHLIVEADSSMSLSTGMQGLCIRIARSLNRLMVRKGPVFADHFHSRLLPSPTEVTRAIQYVLDNHRKHYGSSGTDPYASPSLTAAERDRVLAKPMTWMLRDGWRRAVKRLARD